MTKAHETIDSLWAYCSDISRVTPRDWQKLYGMLANKRRNSSGGWEPPLPLILAAWHSTTPIEKQLRFKEHIAWAAKQEQLDEIGAFLVCTAYAKRIMELPAVQEWVQAALMEPDEIDELDAEF